MKFSIRTTQSPDKASWQVTIKCADQNFKFDPRQLKHIGEANVGFPVPAEALASWKGLPYESLSAPPNEDPSEIKSVYENIIIGDLGAGDIERFGQYLSAVLLGDNWRKMLDAAGKEQIELDLYFDCEDTEMNRLPWEMMYGGDRPFGAYPGRDVAITRIVPLEDKGEVGSLSLPLKVLFVIGRQLDDKLRPGAEYLGLLRRMNIPFEGVPKGRNIDLNTRLLIEATREGLKNAIAEFHPHVVHFICHGTVDAAGGQILLTKSTDDNQKSGGQLEEDPCTAEQLLDDMSQGKAPNNLPPIVVLNACHTADMDNTEPNAATDIKGAYLSLAAELVAGGVPVAIGMAGEIADAACRIFTRNFYQALIKREPVALATARGRRAAMYHYKDFYRDSVEWVRPTLFAAEGVLETFSINKETQEAMLRVAEIPSKYLGDTNVLCGRFRYLRAYQQFQQEIASTSERKVLAFRVSEKEDGPERFGKTRLLEEIAAHSVLDGFIPCLLRNRPGDFEVPANLLSLAILLGDAMGVTRERFAIKKKRLRTNALKYAFKLYNINLNTDPVTDVELIEFEEAKQTVKEKLKNLGNPGEPANPKAEVIKRIILADFRQLYNDVNGIPDPQDAVAGAAPEAAKNAEAPPEKRDLLLLLDDLHLYEGVAPLMLSEAMTGPYGLGDDTLPVPLVFTYSAHIAVSTNALDEIEKFVKRRKYVFKEDLHRIDDESEARLAYSQYLLSRQPPLSFNWLNHKRADVDAVLFLLHEDISGVPTRFYIQGGTVEGVLKLAQKQNTLLTADYEKIMQSLKQLDEQGG